MQNRLYEALAQTFDECRAKELDVAHVTHAHIQPLLQALKSYTECEVKPIGESAEGRSIHKIVIGRGPKKALLWSQMHGDEPTATRALFDVLNFLLHAHFPLEDGTLLAEKILDEVTLHIIPILNPDGAERVWRYNAWGIDLNRDAQALQTPEARLLKGTMELLRPHYGFNLHDQYSYYSTGYSPKPATVSFLANPIDRACTIPAHRRESMQLIVHINKGLQALAPQEVGRYMADFDATSFGDTSQSLGICTMLIESGGGGPQDRYRTKARKLNFVSIILALHGIATGQHLQEDPNVYEEIPNNKLRLFDYLLKNVGFVLPSGQQIRLDIGVNQTKQVWEGVPYLKGTIANFGDLSSYNGLQEFDCEELILTWPVAYTGKYNEREALNYLRKGQLFAISESKADKPYTDEAINYAASSPNFVLERDVPANFMLAKANGEMCYALLNGFFIDLALPNLKDVYGLTFA